MLSIGKFISTDDYCSSVCESVLFMQTKISLKRQVNNVFNQAIGMKCFVQGVDQTQDIRFPAQVDD